VLLEVLDDVTRVEKVANLLDLLFLFATFFPLQKLAAKRDPDAEKTAQEEADNDDEGALRRGAAERHLGRFNHRKDRSLALQVEAHLRQLLLELAVELLFESHLSSQPIFLKPKGR
jgi:hypothetical protein